MCGAAMEKRGGLSTVRHSTLWQCHYTHLNSYITRLPAAFSANARGMHVHHNGQPQLGPGPSDGGGGGASMAALPGASTELSPLRMDAAAPSETLGM